MDSNNKKPKVALIIPCYKALGKIDKVIMGVLDTFNQIKEFYDYKLIIINDACPHNSTKYIKENNFLKIINNKFNIGVGGSTLKGINYALENKFDVIIKIDADGQHPPIYLTELIKYILSLPEYKLFLTKGTRYKIRFNSDYVPFIRRLGTLFLDPIARAALGYRGLSDVTNGFFGMNSTCASILVKTKSGSKIRSRYLFESSLLTKCSELEININQFCMNAIYSKDWNSSMNAYNMIFPLILFWANSLVRRILRNYCLNINLGSFLLLNTFVMAFLSGTLFFTKVLPEIQKNILVTAGNSSAFTASFILAVITFVLFLLYDYSSGIRTNIVFFKSLINDK